MTAVNSITLEFSPNDTRNSDVVIYLCFFLQLHSDVKTGETRDW